MFISISISIFSHNRDGSAGFRLVMSTALHKFRHKEGIDSYNNTKKYRTVLPNPPQFRVQQLTLPVAYHILRLFARAASAALRSALRFSAFKTSAMVIVFSTTGPERSALSFSRRSMREGPASLNEGPMVLGSQSGERKSLELEGGGVGDQ